ncbi:trypsin-like serine peptidase [Streptomyces sp. NPDC058989]|uniref:trypsin-like serine peptidase n=1 Tax=Streptomyces sp. NPDC058989 TaxID=3346686 RepID=UPI003675B587
MARENGMTPGNNYRAAGNGDVAPDHHQMAPGHGEMAAGDDGMAPRDLGMAPGGGRVAPGGSEGAPADTERGESARRTRRRWTRAATAALGMAMCLVTAPVGHASDGVPGTSDSSRPHPGPVLGSRDAAAYWTPERMAAAAPADDAAPADEAPPADGDTPDQSSPAAPPEEGTPSQPPTNPDGGDAPSQPPAAPPGAETPGQSPTTPAGGDTPSQPPVAPPGKDTPDQSPTEPSPTTPSPTTPPASGSPDRPSDAAAAQSPATARHFDGIPSVGVLFSVDKDARAHHCTASVVHSRHRNLILTAGHCNPGARAAFVPQYRSGAQTQPYGVWAINKSFAYPERGTTGDKADLDFAFATVAPAEDGRSLEEVTGGNILTATPGYTNDVTVIGYPKVRNDPEDRAVRCDTRSARLAGTRQLRMECGGFAAGTSGGPWLTDLDEETGTGRIIGLIGGLNGGGPKGPDHDRISYSPYFGGKILALYTRASQA